MKTFLQAVSVGNYVKESLIDGSEGKVMGITSKGIFLLFGNKSLFLTLNDHDSPFNVILPADGILPGELSVSDSVYYSQEDLLIPTRELTVSLHGSPVWTPAPPCSILNDDVSQVAHSQILSDEIVKAGPEKGFFFLTHAPDQEVPQQTAIRQSTQQFSLAFQANHLSECVIAAEQLFGLGSGLTPSGDDWITGYILYHTRLDLAMKQNIRPFIVSLGAELLFSSYHKTTWISTNRLEAALKGWSEAFFLAAINFLFNSSSANPQEVARILYRFGHSSGVDTFTGIANACKSKVDLSIKK
jgi:hypothetical protein